MVGGIGALSLKSIRHRKAVTQPASSVVEHELLVLLVNPMVEPISDISFAANPSPNLRHDVNSALNLILAFCETLLTPKSANRPPLSAPFREDVDAIFHNAQKLKPLIEYLLDRNDTLRPDIPMTHHVTSGSLGGVIVLDKGGAAFELFRQYIHGYRAIRASTIEEIGRLKQDGDPVAVIINGEDLTLIPIVAQLVGNTIPILTFNLTDVQSPMQFHGARDYLMKPVEIESLLAALERIGVAPHTTLIIDDNRDSIQMLSRMLDSLPEPPRLLKAYSGREALALLREEIPDVILLDFLLPDMDGVAILDYLRLEPRLAHIPVLLISAHRPPDVLTVPGINKLTLFRLIGFTPALLAQHIEALLTTMTAKL